MDLYLKSLLYFNKVAELEHVTQAARELYISQAQLSRVISELESRLGVKLFDRVGKGVRLNDSGRAFYEYAKQVLDLTDNAERRVREVYRQREACLTLVSNCSAFLPGALHALRVNAPALEFRLKTADLARCYTHLDEGTTDFAITCPMIEDPQIHTILLRKEPLAVIYPPGHWLENRERVPLQELANESFVGEAPGGAVRELCDRAFDRFHFAPFYRVETVEALLLPRFVQDGLGIALVPRSLFAHDAVFQSRIAELEEPVYGSIGLSLAMNRRSSDKDVQLIELLRTYYVSLDS